MSSALNPTRASHSAAATDAGAAAPAQGRPVAIVITTVLQDTVAVAVATVPLGRPPVEWECRIQASGSGCVGRHPQCWQWQQWRRRGWWRVDHQNGATPHTLGYCHYTTVRCYHCNTYTSNERIIIKILIMIMIMMHDNYVYIWMRIFTMLNYVIDMDDLPMIEDWHRA